MKSRIFAKLLLSFLLVIGTATLILDFVIRQAWEQSLKAEIRAELTQKTQLLANRVQSDHSRPLAKLVAEEASAANARATVIEASGGPSQGKNHHRFFELDAGCRPIHDGQSGIRAAAASSCGERAGGDQADTLKHLPMK